MAAFARMLSALLNPAMHVLAASTRCTPVAVHAEFVVVDVLRSFRDRHRVPQDAIRGLAKNRRLPWALRPFPAKFGVRPHGLRGRDPQETPSGRPGQQGYRWSLSKNGCDGSEVVVHDVASLLPGMGTFRHCAYQAPNEVIVAPGDDNSGLSVRLRPWSTQIHIFWIALITFATFGKLQNCGNHVPSSKRLGFVPPGP